LSELLPGKVINLGDASGQHCGAWLARNLVTADVAGIGLDPDVIQMIRQIDAFQHKMPQWSKSAHQSLIEQVNVRKVHKECNALTRAFLREEHSEGAIDTRTSQPVLGWTTQLFEFSARKNVVGPKPTKQQTKQQRRYRKAPELDGQRSCSRCGKVRLTREQLDAVDAVYGVDSCKKESCDNMSMTSTAPSLADVQGALDMTVSRHDQNVALQDNAPFIVHKKDGVFVLYKISGLPTVDSTRKGKKAKKEERNVGQWLHEQFGLDKDTLGWTGLVHRLDKGTSGVLLAGWHESAHQALIKQRNARKLRKEYVALIRGFLPDEHRKGTIDASLQTDQEGNDAFRTSISSGGPKAKDAVTHYWVCGMYTWNGEPMTLMYLNIETGRTHQIRVHLQYLAQKFDLPCHGIIGDTRYQSKNGLQSFDSQLFQASGATQRMLLHSVLLEFENPKDAQRVQVKCPLPDHGFGQLLRHPNMHRVRCALPAGLPAYARDVVLDVHNPLWRVTE